MALPEFTRKLIEGKLSKYCKNQIPGEVSHNVRLIFRITENNVTLVLTRPYFRKPAQWAERSVAQFRFNNEDNKWQLYFMDRNNSWHPYSFFPSSTDFDDLLKELDRDPLGIFWG